MHRLAQLIALVMLVMYIQSKGDQSMAMLTAGAGTLGACLFVSCCEAWLEPKCHY